MNPIFRDSRIKILAWVLSVVAAAAVGYQLKGPSIRIVHQPASPPVVPSPPYPGPATPSMMGGLPPGHPVVPPTALPGPGK